MTSKTAALAEFLNGSAFVPMGSGWQAHECYHAARAIVNGNRCVGIDRRADRVRKALSKFRIVVSYPPSLNGSIRLFNPETKQERVLVP